MASRGPLSGSGAGSHPERTGPLPYCVVHRPGGTPRPAAGEMPTFPEVRGRRACTPDAPNGRRTSSPRSTVLTVLSQSTAWSATPEETGPGSATGRGSDGSAPGQACEVSPHFGLRQDAAVLSSSSQTELKARLSSKSLTVFLLKVVERTGRCLARLRGRRSRCRTCGAAHSRRPQVK